MNINAIGSSGYNSMQMGSMQRLQGGQMDISAMVSKIMEKQDANGDGSISSDETKLSSDVFKKLDTNGDGKLSADEITAGLQQRQEDWAKMRAAHSQLGDKFDPAKMASNIIQKNDTDGDGLLSASETKMSTEKFNKLDTNGDGKLSADELAAGIQAHHGHHQGMMPPPPPDQNGTGTDSSNSTDMLAALLQTMGQNDASTAYSSTSSLASSVIQSSSSTLSVTG